MTDNEIVKAWEKVLNNSDEPIGEHWMVFVTTQMAKETFDMLTRQKAEIERLLPFGCQVEVSDKIEQEIKHEAYREFAEKVKAKADRGFWQEHSYVDTEDIDNTLKELTRNLHGTCTESNE